MYRYQINNPDFAYVHLLNDPKTFLCRLGIHQWREHGYSFLGGDTVLVVDRCLRCYRFRLQGDREEFTNRIDKLMGRATNDGMVKQV